QTADTALEIAGLVTRLENAQDAMNNFYNEPPIARELRKYIPHSGNIPEQINDEYVRVLIRCRVGRRSGVATVAVGVYDELIDLFGEPQIRAFITTLGRPELASRLEDGGAANAFGPLRSASEPRSFRSHSSACSMLSRAPPIKYCHCSGVMPSFSAWWR